MSSAGNGQDGSPGSPPISALVAGLCEGDPQSEMTLHDLLDAFSERAFGFLILIFALPNGIPAPIAPGLSAVLGLPLVLLAAQMMIGLPHPWMPRAWLARKLKREQVARMLRPSVPVLQRIERYIKPRLHVFAPADASRLLGALLLWNALLLSLPIPFGNLLPAWAIILLALGEMARDGLLVLCGLVMSVLAGFWVGFLLWGGTALIEKLF